VIIVIVIGRGRHCRLTLSHPYNVHAHCAITTNTIIVVVITIIIMIRTSTTGATRSQHFHIAGKRYDHVVAQQMLLLLKVIHVVTIITIETVCTIIVTVYDNRLVAVVCERVRISCGRCRRLHCLMMMDEIRFGLRLMVGMGAG
jgi:hypothetical protein